MLETLNKIKNTEENKKLVQLIKSRLVDLEKEIKQMSKDKIKNQNPYEIVDVVKKILQFNRQKQQGQGLKILTSDQILSRLPITSAQLQDGNNSEKLKNEIRQVLYFLYCSKKLSKTIYKHLMNIVQKWKQYL